MSDKWTIEYGLSITRPVNVAQIHGCVDAIALKDLEAIVSKPSDKSTFKRSSLECSYCGFLTSGGGYKCRSCGAPK